MADSLAPFSGDALWLLPVGALLLAFGRRISWLSLALAGFWLGLELSLHFAAQAPLWLQLGASALLGILSAAIALLVVRLGVAVVGFFLGGYGLVSVFERWQPPVELGTWKWLVIVLGALLCALLFALLFDLALVVITSIAGAVLLVAACGLEGAPGVVLVLVLVALGIAFQTRPRPRPKRRLAAN